jgi:PAS domain S-box-containing protein
MPKVISPPTSGAEDPAIQLRKMEERLRAAAQQWRTTFDAIGEGICLLNAEFQVLRCNPVMIRLLGRGFDELVGQRWTAVVPDGTREIWDGLLRQVRQTRRHQSTDIHADGRWLHVKGDPVLDERGALSGAVIVAGNITERRSAEETLRDSEARYRLLFDSVPSSVLLVDENLHVALANRNFLERSRRSTQATLGKPLSEVFPEVILEELGLRRQIRQVFESKHAFTGQHLTYRAPGVPLRTYYYRLIPITRAGNVEHAMLLMDDVTEQIRLGEEIRRVERHLASVVESANEIVLSTDVTGRIMTWNRFAEQLSGYTLNDVKGRFLFEFCGEDCRETMHAFFAGGDASGIAEYGLETRKGVRLAISWVFSPMKDDREQTVAIVAVGRDLTERRKFEQQLLQSQKLAALGVMAGGIAHEIRTPLAISSSAAQFLMEDDLTPEFRKECAAKVQIGLHRASTIIENLLRFARPAGRSDVTEVNLSSVLEEALTLVANQARIQKIDIVRDLPPGALRVSGVASLLEQVFLNLFLNACNAMADGGRLHLSVERIGREARVRITDTGCGIAAADIGNIFDPFYTRAPVGRGTGLGLSICYSIVEQHSGSIEVDSAPGRGSTFTVKLPVLS